MCCEAAGGLLCHLLGGGSPPLAISALWLWLLNVLSLLVLGDVDSWPGDDPGRGDGKLF